MTNDMPLQEPKSTPAIEVHTLVEDSNGQNVQKSHLPVVQTPTSEPAEVEAIIPLLILDGTDESSPREEATSVASTDESVAAGVPFQLWPYVGTDIVIPQQQPTWMQAFLGIMFDVRQQLKDVLTATQEQITEVKHLESTHQGTLSAMQAEQLGQMVQYRQRLLHALETYQWTTAQIWLYQWSMVFLAVIMTLFEATAVIVYARWHGVNLLSADFYSASQITALSNMNFVNGPVTMSIIAEILMWSSLGVWASYSYQYGRLMVERKFRFADHGPMYIAHLTRNTGVVAAVILLLRLSQFSIFGISIADSSPLGFDSTIGLAFLLGFFGDDATQLLLAIKNLIMGQVEKNHEEAGALS